MNVPGRRVGKKVRFGVIGAGWWAEKNHLPILASHPDVELVSVCRKGTAELGRLVERFGFSHATEDYRELLELDLEAVVVASPHHLHHEHTMAALRRGLHVLVEKPMALQARDAWEITAAASEHDCHVLVPVGWNHSRLAVEAKRLIDGGGLGDVRYVMCQMASPTAHLFDAEALGATPPRDGQRDRSTWTSPTAGGGYVHGQLTHALSLMVWLTGLRAASVNAVVSGPGTSIDIYNAANLTFDGGAIGTLSGAATLPVGDRFQVDLRIFGSAGVLLLDMERERLQLRRHDGRHDEVVVEAGEGDYECITPIERFVDLIVGRSTENNSPAEVAARAVEIAEALLDSASTGRSVAILAGRSPRGGCPGPC
jgi:predicted dehydrogenase